MDPPFMAWVHGPFIFTNPKNSFMEQFIHELQQILPNKKANITRA